MFFRRLKNLRAADFPPGLEWLNSSALSLQKLRGKKVVLLDFWTYSCVNCHRTFPHLKRWRKTYGDKGLEIIGVHTPEFAFEKDAANVERAVKDFGLSYPIVLDPEYAIWNLYGNQHWPHHYLIDREGYIVYDHAGEGGYAETEMHIQKALKELGAKDLPAIGPDASLGGQVCYRTTPELYLGFLRGAMGNRKEFLPDVEESFEDVAQHDDDLPYLHGHWKIAAEYLEHNRKLALANEYLLLKYSAFSVNVVMSTMDGRSAVIEIELDGKPLPKDFAGDDVRIDKEGHATVTVKEPRLYRLVNATTYHRATLKLKTASGNLRLYAFTFGGCEET